MKQKIAFVGRRLKRTTNAKYIVSPWLQNAPYYYWRRKAKATPRCKLLQETNHESKIRDQKHIDLVKY
jgi:hypothetical protein